jgi:hypothetical protein
LDEEKRTAEVGERRHRGDAEELDRPPIAKSTDWKWKVAMAIAAPTR